MSRGIVIMKNPILSLAQIVFFVELHYKDAKEFQHTVHLLTDSSTLRNELEMYETLNIKEHSKNYFPL